MKRVIYVFLILVFSCTVLMGCINQKPKLIEEAKELCFSKNDLNIEKADYGEIAYKYLQEIQSFYPARIAGSAREKDMAVFLISAILNGGYEEKDIEVHTFEIDDSVPAQGESIKNVFDSGEKSNLSQNIEVIKKGESEKTIIVGAHYDSVGTYGVDDNGSGVAVVLENVLRMVDESPFYTIKYVFFGSEEIGMYGSRSYVEELTSKEKDNIVLMINVDTILAGDNLYMYGGKVNRDGNVDNSEAVFEAYDIVKELGLNIQLPPKGNNDYPYPTGQKRSDHAPFNDVDIPYIYFEANNWINGNSSETEKNGLIMHTDLDDLEFIESEYGERARKNIKEYSLLLDALIN